MADASATTTTPAAAEPMAIKTPEAFAELLKAHTFVVVDFHATWCGPCKMVAPVFAQHAAAHSTPGKIAFAKVDVDEVPDVAKRYRVTSLPTFLFVKDGEEYEELKGINPARLKSEVESLVREVKEADGKANEVTKALGDEDW